MYIFLDEFGQFAKHKDEQYKETLRNNILGTGKELFESSWEEKQKNQSY